MLFKTISATQQRKIRNNANSLLIHTHYIIKIKIAHLFAWYFLNEGGRWTRTDRMLHITVSLFSLLNYTTENYDTQLTTECQNFFTFLPNIVKNFLHWTVNFADFTPQICLKVAKKVFFIPFFLLLCKFYAHS